MSSIFRNVRGLNSPSRKLHVSDLIYKCQASFVALLEHKLSSDNIYKFQNSCLQNWSIHHNKSSHTNDRILIIWNPTIRNATIIGTYDQVITCLVRNSGGLILIVPCIYGLNDTNKRTHLWNYIAQIAKNKNIPSLLAGDFYSTLYSTDRKGESNVHTDSKRLRFMY